METRLTANLTTISIGDINEKIDSSPGIINKIELAEKNINRISQELQAAEVEFAHTQAELLPKEIAQLRQAHASLQQMLLSDRIQWVDACIELLNSRITNINQLKENNQQAKAAIKKNKSSINNNLQNIKKLAKRQQELPGLINTLNLKIAADRLAHEASQRQLRREHEHRHRHHQENTLLTVLEGIAFVAEAFNDYYDQQRLTDYYTELQSIPAQISRLQADNNELQQANTQNDTVIKCNLLSITNLESSLYAVDQCQANKPRNLADLTKESKKLKHIESLEKELNRCISLISDTKRKNTLSRAEITSRMTHLQEDLSKAKANKVQLESDKTSIENNILISAPQNSLIMLANKIKAVFNEFESSHYTIQTEIIRLCLFDAQNKIDHIVGMSGENNDLQRKAYYQLYGMLADFQQRLHESDKLIINKQFAEKIQLLLNCYSIDSVKPLFLIPEECIAIFAAAKLEDALLQDLDAEALHAKEKALYDDAVINLINTLNHLGDDAISKKIYQQGRSLLKEIQIYSLKEKSESGILKLSTTTLNKTNAAIQTLYSANFAERQNVLADFKSLTNQFEDGQPRMDVKILGIVTALCGTILMALGALSLVGTIGGSIAASATLLSCGALIVSSGLGLFSHGRRKGVSKGLYGLDNTFSQSNEPAQLESPLINHSGPSLIYGIA